MEANAITIHFRYIRKGNLLPSEFSQTFTREEALSEMAKMFKDNSVAIIKVVEHTYVVLPPFEYTRDDVVLKQRIKRDPEATADKVSATEHSVMMLESGTTPEREAFSKIIERVNQSYREAYPNGGNVYTTLTRRDFGKREATAEHLSTFKGN